VELPRIWNEFAREELRPVVNDQLPERCTSLSACHEDEIFVADHVAQILEVEPHLFTSSVSVGVASIGALGQPLNLAALGVATVGVRAMPRLLERDSIWDLMGLPG
jgi:hypothetical protein